MTSCFQNNNNRPSYDEILKRVLDFDFTGHCKSPIQGQTTGEGTVFRCPYCPYAKDKAILIRSHINVKHELTNFYQVADHIFSVESFDYFLGYMIGNALPRGHQGILD